MKVKLDWMAYYQRFKQVHGEYPVKYGGKLLFPDGWQYALDPQGPEFRPAEGAITFLQVKYWQLRKSIIHEELTLLEWQYNALRDLQSTKSAPLQQVIFMEDEGGAKKKQVVDFQLSDLEGRLQWLRSDLAECEEQLSILQNKESSNG